MMHTGLIVAIPDIISNHFSNPFRMLISQNVCLASLQVVQAQRKVTEGGDPTEPAMRSPTVTVL